MNEILLVNPRKRRKSKGKKSRRGRVRLKRASSRRRAVRRVKARRYKRNPSGGGFSLKSIGSQVVPVVKAGALGAVGALANDALVGQALKLSFLPDALRSGYGKHALKVGSAIVVGVAGNMVARGKGRDLAVGAATVAMHGLLKEVVSSNFPSVAAYLGDYDSGDYDGNVSGYNPAQVVDQSNVGEYIPGVGEYIPGMVGGVDDDM
jgi:hypothetical protein